MSKELFITYLEEDKKAAPNTAEAYCRDVDHFGLFLRGRGIDNFEDASNTDIVAYLMELKSEGRSKSTVNRKLASIRTYYNFMQKKLGLAHNPTENIKSPKIEKKNIEFLELSDIDKLMELPDDSCKGIRDRAMLELLYATGIRASELIDMKCEDLNLRMGYVTCAGENIRPRIIPIGKMAKEALETYLDRSRNLLVRSNEEERHLFVNYHGSPITRQGLWKVLKEYGQMADLKINLTPQVLRNSFAVHMLQNGADVKSLQELMGHEDISATQVYLAFTKNRIKDVYDRAHPRA